MPPPAVRTPSQKWSFVRSVSSLIPRRDAFVLSVRRAEQILRILQGMVGAQLKLLLVPVMQLYFRKRRRRAAVSVRSEMTTDQSTLLLVDYCLLHPLLTSLGRDLMHNVLAHSKRICYFPQDVVLYPGEPTRSAGIVICTTGTLLVHYRVNKVAAVSQAVMQSLRSTNPNGSTALLEGDMLRAVEGDAVLAAPQVMGVVRALTDMSNPYLIVADSRVDAFLISYDTIHAAVAGRFGGGSGTTAPPWTNGAATVAIDDTVPTRSAMSSEVLAARLVVAQSQFPLGDVFLRQSWLIQGLPEDVVDAVANQMECRCYAPGDVLVESGRHAPGVLFLRRGVAQIRSSHVPGAATQHATTPRTFLFPGCVVGERSAVFRDRCRETICAASFCDAWVLPMAEMNRLRSNERIGVAWNQVGVEMAVQWLNNMRADEVRRFEHRGEETKRRTPNLIRKIIEALVTVPYLAKAPDALLQALASVAMPRVFLPHCALTTCSAWSNALYVVTKGIATVQHGLTSRLAPPEYPWTYRAGSCVGMECVVWHRSLFSTCSVQMVEAWCIPRLALRSLLSDFGILGDAEATVELVLSDLQKRCLVSSVERGSPSVSASRPPREEGTTHSARHRRTTSPTRNEMPSHCRGGARRCEGSGSGATPQVVDDATVSPSHAQPVVIDGVCFSVDVADADINRGVAGLGACLSFLSSIETERHRRIVRCLFPETATWLGAAGGRSKAIRALDGLDEARALSERYHALAEHLLPQYKEDAPATSCSLTDTMMAAVSQTFEEVGHRADAKQQIHQLQLSSSLSWGEGDASMASTSTDEDDNEDDEVDELSLSAIMGRTMKRSPRCALQHILPTTLLVVQVSEVVGEWSPWLLQLLGRRGGIWGYLEGSDAEMGTMVTATLATADGVSRRRSMVLEDVSLSRSLLPPGPLRLMQASARHSSNIGYLLGSSARRSPASSASATVDVPLPIPSRRRSRKGGSLVALPVAVGSYKPMNPHGYDARPPETQRHRSMASAWEAGVALDGQHSAGRRGNRASRVRFPTAAKESPTRPTVDTQDEDVIARVLQHAAQLHVAGGGGGSGQSRTGVAGALSQTPADLDYFEEEWRMMLHGEGVYCDENLKGMRLREAARKRAKQRQLDAQSKAPLSPQAPTSSQQVVSPGTARRVSMFATSLPSEPIGDEEGQQRTGTVAARLHSIMHGAAMAPSVFADEYRVYLNRAYARLDAGTRKATEELERQVEEDASSASSDAESAQRSSMLPTVVDATVPLVVVPQQRHVHCEGGTRSALLLPATLPRPSTGAQPRVGTVRHIGLHKRHW